MRWYLAILQGRVAWWSTYDGLGCEVYNNDNIWWPAVCTNILLHASVHERLFFVPSNWPISLCIAAAGGNCDRTNLFFSDATVLFSPIYLFFLVFRRVFSPPETLRFWQWYNYQSPLNVNGCLLCGDTCATFRTTETV